MKIETPLTLRRGNARDVIFKACPKCESTDIFNFEDDSFCNPCGWNSIDMYVESQLATHVFKYKAKTTDIAKTPTSPSFSDLDVSSRNITPATRAAVA